MERCCHEADRHRTHNGAGSEVGECLAEPGAGEIKGGIHLSVAVMQVRGDDMVYARKYGTGVGRRQFDQIDNDEVGTRALGVDYNNTRSTHASGRCRHFHSSPHHEHKHEHEKAARSVAPNYSRATMCNMAFPFFILPSFNLPNTSRRSCLSVWLLAIFPNFENMSKISGERIRNAPSR